jgi:hypothetical protein
MLFFSLKPFGETFINPKIEFLGVTNSTPLNRNLAPEICKKRDTEGLVCSSVFFLVYNWFKNPESHFFI